MLSTRQTQSLSDFRQKAAETLDRINRTGNAEILTVNGQARAVLLSPAAYDRLSQEIDLAHDVATMRKAMKDIDDGKGVKARTFFKKMRSELLAMKANQRRNAAE